jgi:hypothetical protein
MELKLLFYCFLSVVIITGGGYFLFSSRQETTAAIYFLGSTVAAIFFGFRWFTMPGSNPSSGPWPPSINFCPDFLTLTKINGKPACIDMIGVSSNGALNVNDGTNTGASYYFDLKTDSTTTRLRELCDQVTAQGLSWEGVSDGITCSTTVPPLPPNI